MMVIVSPNNNVCVNEIIHYGHYDKTKMYV